MDSLLIRERSIGGNACLLAIVSDGVGSVADGGFASSVATAELGNWFDSLQQVNERTGLEMRNHVMYLDSYIKELSERNFKDAASTFTAMLIVEGRYYIVHLGDTRVYEYGADGILAQITTDQVSSSGRLRGFIGKPDSILPEFVEGSSDGKTMLLCSDGMYKKAEHGEIQDFIAHWDWSRGEELMQGYIDMVVERGEQDNITFAVLSTK